jgi:acetyl esterase
MMRRDPFPGPAVYRVDDLEAVGPAGPLRLRVYRPNALHDLPAVVYYHGGGFSLGDLDTHDRICRLLASRAQALVVSVDYRLAPEHPFPAAVDDAYAALRWVHGHANGLDADPGRLTVAGDSAGGNLAAVAAIRARDEGGVPLVFQLLIYPVTDLSSFATRSHEDLKEGFLLSRTFAEAMRRAYVPLPEDRRRPYASPLLAPDLQGLPPALIITAQFDPLRDEGEAYGRRLAAAGVKVATIRYNGVTHGFFGVGVLRKGRQAVDDAASALKEAFVTR